MKHLLLFTGLSLLVACGSGTTDVDVGDGTPPLTQESVADMTLPDMADRMIADGEMLGTLLADVTSVESAEAVQPRIEAMMENYRLMFEQLETIDNPGFSDMAALASRAPQIARTQEELVRQVQRIHADHPEAADVLRKTLDNLVKP